MIKTPGFFICLLAVAIGINCASSRSKSTLTINQGIEGFVGSQKGNQMPSPDMPAAQPTPVSTALYIHELTNIKDVQKSGTAAFYTQINTRLIKTVLSDTSGKFLVELPVGQYSLFIKKGKLFYANQFDEKNNIFPVKVDSLQLSKISFIDNSAATF